jgi:glycosyltransferase involved in cell wall biosynthesis
MSALFIFFIVMWCLFLFFTQKAIKSLKRLDEFKQLPSSKLPSLSIVLAVKDEEREIEKTLLTVLNSGYKDIEVIVVNDRSIDKTQSIIKSVQDSHPNLKTIKIETLPTGWLGKVHALHQGVKLATSEFILFTDGDVEINLDVIRSSLSICVDQKLDHLTIIPNIPCPTFPLKLLILTSKLLFTLSSRPWLPIESRPLNTIVGIGPFNLIRNSYFKKTEGFEWLKMDVADDVALSHLIAKDGGRSLYIQAAAYGPHFPWYKDAVHMMHGLEKNIVGGFANYKLPLVFLVSFCALSSFIVPIAALLSGNTTIFSIGIITLFINFIFALRIKSDFPFNTFTRFLFPLGIFMLGIILLRSAFICFKNGGIFWSGTFYPLKDLKKGTRVKLGL